MTSHRCTLPALPYDYGALEPHIERSLLEWHHLKYHGGIVDRIHELSSVRGGEQRRCELNRCMSEHRLHSIFWCNLDPRGGRAPFGELHDVLCEHFGDLQQFHDQLTAVAMQARAWAALMMDLDVGELHIVEIDVATGMGNRRAPLMVVDVAEHAYAAQYGRNRRTYLTALSHVWNWQDIAERYRDVRPGGRHEAGLWM